MVHGIAKCTFNLFVHMFEKTNAFIVEHMKLEDFLYHVMNKHEHKVKDIMKAIRMLFRDMFFPLTRHL
jgi:hypothetical protein